MRQRALKLVLGPSTEPITLVEAKLHVRQDLADDDTLISGLIVAAREEVERVSWHALITQTWEVVLDRWPGDLSGDHLELPKPPLQSVASIIYTDVPGTPTTWTAPNNYIVDTDSLPGRVVLADGATWPSAVLTPSGGIRVRFVAGWANAGLVPQLYKQAMLLLIGHWYENREATGDANSRGSISFGVESLLRSSRMEVMRR
ncbi:MAG: head-tail connector protein [Vicinamibacteria bacterium]